MKNTIANIKNNAAAAKKTIFISIVYHIVEVATRPMRLQYISIFFGLLEYCYQTRAPKHTLLVGNEVHTIKMTQRVIDRLKEIDVQEQNRPCIVFPAAAPQLEGYAEETRILSEGGNFPRMISEDCVRSGEYYSRQSFDLPNLPIHQRYGFQAKRMTGERPTPATMTAAKDTIDAIINNGFDTKALNQILADKTAREWLSTNLDELPSMDAGQPPTPSEILFGDYNDDILEIPEDETPEEGFIPEIAGYSWFPLAKDVKSFHKIWETILPMRKASLKTLKGMATKAMRKESEIYNRWNNKEQESFWTTYNVQKERALGHHSKLGAEATKKAEHRRDNNELTPTVKAKMKRFIMDTASLNDRDRESLWNIYNGKKAKAPRRKRGTEYPVVVR
jgi:hypothetical protein